MEAVLFLHWSLADFGLKFIPYRSKMEDKLYTLGFGLDRD